MLEDYQAQIIRQQDEKMARIQQAIGGIRWVCENLESLEAVRTVLKIVRELNLPPEDEENRS